MKPNMCVRRTLAMGELGVVEQCSCGAVHVTIGAVTLRLASSAIGSLAEIFGEASRVLAGELPRARHVLPEVLS